MLTHLSAPCTVAQELLMNLLIMDISLLKYSVCCTGASCSSPQGELLSYCSGSLSFCIIAFFSNTAVLSFRFLKKKLHRKGEIPTNPFSCLQKQSSLLCKQYSTNSGVSALLLASDIHSDPTSFPASVEGLQLLLQPLSLFSSHWHQTLGKFGGICIQQNICFLEITF